MKQIQIRCKGTSALPLDFFQNLQGNLKELRESEYKKLRRSIEKYGFRFPIFVWGNMILDGHQRILVLKKMISDGWSIDPLPVIEIEAENEKEAKHLLLLISSRYGHITDDGLYEFIMTSELNFDELKEEIDLPGIDFKQFEQNYFSEELKDAEPQVDRAEELNKKWQVKTGDLWQIGKHRLLCGDSTKKEDVERVMEKEKAELVLTDPPYGIDIVKLKGAGGKLGFIGAGGWVPVRPYKQVEGDDKPFEPEFLLKLGINQIIFGGNYFANKLSNHACWIVWDKREGIPSNNFADCEIAWTSFDSPARIYHHLWSGLLRKGDRKMDGVSKSHPTQKPVGLFINILEDFSEAGNIILDPFLGSGTTMIACQNLNRKCRGIEISPAYCAVILERMATVFPGIEIKRI